MSMDILDVDMKNKRDDEDSFKEDWLMKDLMIGKDWIGR